MKIGILILLVAVFGIKNLKAETYSMRDCMLLPITDNVGDAMAFKVYEEIEQYLKTSGWCNYKPSSELLNVFSKYRDKLDQHLEEPDVLRTVADRLQVGSMVLIKMNGAADSITLEIKIFGENGKDVYLSEKVLLNKVDLFLVNQTIKNWLELYEVAIPYDGRVLGILGDQLTFRAGNRKAFKLNNIIQIKKVVRKKEHPLLQQIVAWETIEVARGKIANISYDQGLAKIEAYTSREKIEKGDWVVILEDESKAQAFHRGEKFEENEKYSFGRLGELEISLDLSNASVGVSKSTGNIKLGGYIYGITAELEAWLTRDYFVIGEFVRKVGNISDTSGAPTLTNATITAGHYKVGGGYKLLPLGYFYGPQINLYGGYANYFYDVEDSAVDYLGEGNITGFFVGVGGNMPLKKGLRIYGKGEIIPFSKFSESGTIYGSSKSSSSVVFEVGAKFQYNPIMKFFGAMEIMNSSVKFNSEPSEVNYKESVFKAGINYTF